MVCNHITNLWKKRFEEWNIIQSVRNLQKILSFYQQVRGDGQNLKGHWPISLDDFWNEWNAFVEFIKRPLET